jgi:hypothetical protein
MLCTVNLHRLWKTGIIKFARKSPENQLKTIFDKFIVCNPRIPGSRFSFKNFKFLSVPVLALQKKRNGVYEEYEKKVDIVLDHHNFEKSSCQNLTKIQKEGRNTICWNFYGILVIDFTDRSTKVTGNYYAKIM